MKASTRLQRLPLCAIGLLLSCQGSQADRESERGEEDLGTAEQPSIPVPSNFVRYCSRTNGTSWELVYDPNDSTPCTTALGGAGTIRRAGLWENRSAAYNGVVAHCMSGPGIFGVKEKFYGLGNSALVAAEAWGNSGSRHSCYFTVAPRTMPIFQRPMSASTMANIDPTGRGVDLALGVTFQPDGSCLPVPSPSNYVDYRGHGSDVFPEPDGDTNSNHAAYDWTDADEWADRTGNSATWNIYAAAEGTVVLKRYRWVGVGVGLCSGPGTDCQAEVYIKHTVGSYPYREEFITYYAHFDSIAVNSGATVTKGQYLGEVGDSGCEPCHEHLHFGVFRLTNTAFAWRHDWEDFFYGASVHLEPTQIDPFGYQPACVDPWGYSFTTKGAMSIRLWQESYPELDWSHH